MLSWLIRTYLLSLMSYNCTHALLIKTTEYMGSCECHKSCSYNTLLLSHFTFLYSHPVVSSESIFRHAIKYVIFFAQWPNRAYQSSDIVWNISYFWKLKKKLYFSAPIRLLISCRNTLMSDVYFRIMPSHVSEAKLVTPTMFDYYTKREFRAT